LEQAFNETVSRLNEQPVLVPLGTITGRSLEGALIDGVWFSAFVFQSLYSEELTALLPRAIFDTRDHEYEILNILADAYLQNAEFISIGMHYSVQCGEEAAFTNRDSTLAAADDYAELTEFNQYQAKSTFAACDVWAAPPAASRENEPVASDIPTLVLAGQLDPITPPVWGQQAAAGLTNSVFLEFPGVGHGVALSDSCPTAISLGFLDNPGLHPASNCIAGMPGVDWFVE
jgi:pimeloyl-ACP methyl ester carboxylesterase